MGEAADDLTDAGELQYELHLSFQCDESDCPYCLAEHWLKEE
jgi:hypothetical protein